LDSGVKISDIAARIDTESDIIFNAKIADDKSLSINIYKRKIVYPPYHYGIQPSGDDVLYGDIQCFKREGKENSIVVAILPFHMLDARPGNLNKDDLINYIQKKTSNGDTIILLARSLIENGLSANYKLSKLSDFLEALFPQDTSFETLGDLARQPLAGEAAQELPGGGAENMPTSGLSEPARELLATGEHSAVYSEGDKIVKIYQDDITKEQLELYKAATQVCGDLLKEYSGIDMVNINSREYKVFYEVAPIEKIIQENGRLATVSIFAEGADLTSLTEKGYIRSSECRIIKDLLFNKTRLVSDKFKYEGIQLGCGSNVKVHVNSKENTLRLVITDVCPQIEYLKLKEVKDAPQEVAYDVFVQSKGVIAKTMLADSPDKVLLRVQIEPLMEMTEDEQGEVKAFLEAVQESKNGYVELCSSDEIEGVSGDLRKKYVTKELPKGFERMRENTITLFELEKDKALSFDGTNLIVGRIKFNPLNTILLPIGARNGPVGMIRSALFGLELAFIARQKAMDLPIEEFATERVETYNALYNSITNKRSELTAEDIIALATSSHVDFINALNKFIKYLPTAPINKEELRRIRENTTTVIRNA